jgi:hypothetical protein
MFTIQTVSESSACNARERALIEEHNGLVARVCASTGAASIQFEPVSRIGCGYLVINGRRVGELAYDGATEAMRNFMRS